MGQLVAEGWGVKVGVGGRSGGGLSCWRLHREMMAKVHLASLHPAPQDSCVRQALHCHRLTKLLTLQIHFLNTGQNTMLINLGRHRLMDCIMSLPRFYQVSTEEKSSQHPLLHVSNAAETDLSQGSGLVSEPGQFSSPGLASDIQIAFL